MLIGICKIHLYLPNSHSLKDKRNVLKSIKVRMQHNHNVSVCEIENFNYWKNTTLGVACIGNDKEYINKVINSIVLFIEKQSELQLTAFEINII